MLETGMPEGSSDLLTEEMKTQSDFTIGAGGKQYYSKKDKFEKPGIELTGYSLVFFKAVEAALESRKKEFLQRLLPNFLKSCQRILECCPGMSAFKGSWRKSSVFLSIDAASQFVGDDFFDGMICLFEGKLEGKNLTVAQTEQVLGTFFISSLVKLHREVMLQGLFHAKLRELAEKLRDNPLTTGSAEREQGITYISKIFQPNIATAELVLNAQEQFESIFQDLESRNCQAFVALVTLFFLKPFPFEVVANARFIQFETESKVYRIAPFVEQLEQKILHLATMGIVSSHTQERTELAQPLVEELNQTKTERKRLEEERALVIRHAGHVQTAFDTVEVALRVVRDAAGFKIFGDKIFREFEEVIKIGVHAQAVDANAINAEAAKKLNPIFHPYFVAVHARKFQQTDFCDVFESALVANVQQIIQNTRQTLQNEAIKPELATAHFLTEMVLAPPAISLRARFYAAASKHTVNFETLEVVPKSAVGYQVHHTAFLEGRRRLICCNPRDRETLSALLNSNPLVKALLLSQVPIAVILQILRVDNNFKDVSTVMWFEPGLALIGFACGVYALKNPKTLVNPPVRIFEALSASSVVLTKSLGIAILAHTALFPEEGGPGSIDIERFLKVIASIPIALALLFWVYNSINPNFKERHFSKHVRFIADLSNHFAIYCGLIQIVNIDIAKIMNRIEKVDFSTQSSRFFFELSPLILAPFFAYARVAPIRFCKRNGVHVNISETVNTAVLYGVTTALLANLAIDLSLADNLPAAQTNFRRVFFPGLVLASMAVMARFARSFHKLYEGNPEVIIQQVIKERGLHPLGDGTFSLAGNSQPLLETHEVDTDLIGSDNKSKTVLDYNAAEAVKKAFEVPGEKKETGELLMYALDKGRRKQDDQYANARPQQRTPNNEGKRARFGSCAML